MENVLFTTRKLGRCHMFYVDSYVTVVFVWRLSYPRRYPVLYFSIGNQTICSDNQCHAVWFISFEVGSWLLKQMSISGYVSRYLYTINTNHGDNSFLQSERSLTRWATLFVYFVIIYMIRNSLLPCTGL